MTSENATPMYMPVAPAYGNGGFGGGFGDGGWWLLVLILAMFNGGWGMGGFGGGMMWPMMAGGIDGFGLYPWLNNSQNINDGFREQMLSTQVNGIQSAITSGFGDVQNSLCSGFAGVNATVNGAANSISQQLNANEIASLNRSFAEQTANSQGFTGLQAQLAQCCCDNRLATCQTQNLIATDGAATRSTIQSAVQTVLDKMCQDKIDEKNETISMLRQELLYARGQASQDVQTAAIRAGQVATIDGLYNRLHDCPVPTYNVPNPNCCNQQPCGCGCGCN